MEAEVLKVVGQVAGIGGLSLGVFLFLFREIIRKKIFPKLTKDQAYRLLRTISFYIWTVALVGIAAWFWGSGNIDDNITQKINGGTGIIQTGPGEINVQNVPEE